MSNFDYWSNVPGHACYHPDDKTVLDRADHSFQLKGLPNPFFGPLKTASVVLLYLSPGYRSEDAELAQRAATHRYFENQRTGKTPLPTIDDYKPTWDWWKRKTGQFGLEIEDIRQNVAVLNICAYRSEKFTDWGMLSSLPSSRASVDWAQATLFPDAESGRRVVICLRAAQYWGLSRKGAKYGISLFSPRVTRGGIMLRDQFRLDVVAAVRAAVRVN
jgi:hypothetical protein